MKSYEIPPSSILNPAQAEAAIHRLQADTRADPAHPLQDRSHPQHDDFVTYFQALHEKASPPPPPPEPLEDDDRAALEAELAEITATPGFVNGKLRDEDRKKHNEILDRRQAIYERLAEGDAATEAEAAAAETDEDDEDDTDTDDLD
jgi:hypothetical protein